MVFQPRFNYCDTLVKHLGTIEAAHAVIKVLPLPPDTALRLRHDAVQKSTRSCKLYNIFLLTQTILVLPTLIFLEDLAEALLDFNSITDLDNWLARTQHGASTSILLRTRTILDCYWA